MIESTWDIIDQEPGVIAEKLQRTAAKQNGAKSSGLQQVWDLGYLHQYVDDIDIKKLKLSELVENAIIKTRAATGWRSADLTGVYVEYSFDFKYKDGKLSELLIRNFDTKVKKGKWSAFTSIPVLAEEFRHLCAARVLLLLRERVRALDSVPTTEVLHPDNGTKPKTTPLFITATKAHAPLKDQTIANKFKNGFLKNITDGEKKLSAKYKPHSCRNAVASTLSELQVPVNSIANHMQTSAENLTSTYITAVKRDWTLPRACAAKHEFLAAKLLLPYVHFQSGGDGKCKCDALLGTISFQE